MAEWTLFFFPLTLFGMKIFGSWTVDYFVALAFGIVFQYFTIAPMRDLSLGKGLLAAAKADFFSLTAWQVGMYGWMAIATFVLFGHELEKTSPLFWFMMQIAMLAGFLTAYPVNWWLIRAGVKEKMEAARPEFRGRDLRGLALIAILRFSAKRTLSKWNAFDFVVTIALGSTLATILLSKDVSVLEGLSALGILITLQFFVTWFSVRFGFVSRLVKAQPALLLYRGEMQRATLPHERVTERELLAALRGAGVANLADAGAVVLETNGSFSVISQLDQTGRSTLADVETPKALA